MVLEDYIERIKMVIEKVFNEDYSGHEMSHLERVYNNARAICEKEGGDILIVGISAYLHDIHRIMSNEENRYVSPKESIPAVKKVLTYAKVPEELQKQICFCIEHHEEYNWNENTPVDLNTQILQDADNLDAIGAIGIARTFQYGGSHNIAIYRPEKGINYKSNYKESDDLEASTIEHFHNKLLRLGEYMNTETAREMAKPRTEFMQAYIEQFMKEWYIFDRQRVK